MLFFIQISVQNIFYGCQYTFCKGASFTINEFKTKAYHYIWSLCYIAAKSVCKTLIPNNHETNEKEECTFQLKQIC